MAEWWRGGVIYQIYPRSFYDSNGDGIGDLPGITEKLDYVASLGVDGIWLSPFFTSPMNDFGYDIADYRDVDTIFGTLADFDRLVARAHSLGLRVVIDQVYSHSSDRCAWFEQSRRSRDNPKADWYVWADPKPDGTPPNNWLSVFGGPAWSWEPRRRQYYLHNFLSTQPDVNLHDPAAQEAMLDVARFWLDRGVDGFRLDVANFYMHDLELRDNPPAEAGEVPAKPVYMQIPVYNRSRPETLGFIARLRAVLESYPERFAVGEIASRQQIRDMVAYTDGPDRLHTAYSFVFLREAFDAGHVRRSIEEMQAASESAWPSWAFSNHDVMRVASRWANPSPTPGFAKLLIALLGCLRGTVFLYQGEELGLPKANVPYDRLQDPEGRTFWPDYESRDNARTPFPWAGDRPQGGFSGGHEVEPWLPMEPAHLALALDRQDVDPDSVLSFTRRFLAWRKRYPALIDGSIRFVDAPEPVLAFERAKDGARLLCAFNLGSQPVRAELAVDGGWTPLPSAGAETLPDPARLSLPGHALAFWRRAAGDA